MKRSATPKGNDGSRGRARRAPTVIAVRHAIQVLRSLSGEGPLGIGELASRVGLHKSTVSRLVATLEDDDLVEREATTRRVRVGAGLLSLTSPLLGRVRIVEVARPYLEELAQRCGETISLSIWDGAGAVNLEQALGGKAIKHYAPPGSRNPAHCTAAGKLLLAFAPPAIVERVLAREMPRFTPRTLVSPAALRSEIATIRRRGHALNLGELASDVGAIAVPIHGPDAQVVAAVTATVPMYRFSGAQRTRLLGLLTASAEAMSDRFGRWDVERMPAGKVER